MVDFDIDMLYHPDRQNLVPDALSRRPSTIFLTCQKELLEMERLDLVVVIPGTTSCMPLRIRSSSGEQIKVAQTEEVKLQEMKDQAVASLRLDIAIHADGLLSFGVRCVSSGVILQKLLAEAHRSSYSIYTIPYILYICHGLLSLVSLMIR